MGLDVGEIGMGLDLSLDLKMFAARSAVKMAAAAAKEEAASGVDACIRSLEEERRKIEMFRRELPLCARLLADVIELMKEEAGKRRKDGDAAAAAAEARAEDGDKTKWMSTAQLWVDSRGSDSDSENERRSGSTSPASRLLGGAEESSRSVGSVGPTPYFRREDRVGLRPAMPLLPPVAHRSPPPAAAAAAGDDHRHVVATSFARDVPSPVPAVSLQTQAQQQQQARKSRRCWSPELHRQFVAALQQLGGPQVATPKQIREVMKVDGLTNDEVKSHLQKYRLHNRKSPGTSPASQSIVLVGDLWVPQEVSCSQSGSPQGPLQLSGSGVAVSAATAGDSCCEDDDKSEGYVRK
ncbi:transcription factor NIGTH1-like [Oryza brachyantha]|uniref:HTH myb-type domain-containing protein n=1 Tax=Oryza brachyantha TaxID=4533 RepID=J3LT47_ORYBR|nr:transcription factor NIGTH1-like [Oryza brachyantha]